MNKISIDEGLEIARRLGLTIYDHKFGNSSNSNLQGVLPEIVDVARLTIRLCQFDGTIISGGGLRTQEQADQNAANGTGVSNSRHLRQSDGYGHAVDVVPYVGRATWDLKYAKPMANAMKIASAILNVPLRQGCDWNMNGSFAENNEHDWCHGENPVDKYKAAAVAELQRFRRVLGIENLEDQTALANCECPVCGAGLQLSAV